MTTPQQLMLKGLASELPPEQRAEFEDSIVALRAALAPFVDDTEGPKMLALAYVMAEVGAKLEGKS